MQLEKQHAPPQASPIFTRNSIEYPKKDYPLESNNPKLMPIIANIDQNTKLVPADGSIDRGGDFSTTIPPFTMLGVRRNIG